mgnify:CR=1 FL=1
MRIAMIGHKEFPSRAGGVEVVVYELATRLTARGVDVTVYITAARKSIITDIKSWASMWFVRSHRKTRV